MHRCTEVSTQCFSHGPFDAIYRRSQLRLKAQKEVHEGIDSYVNVFRQLSTKSEKNALSSSGLHCHLYPSWHALLSSASFLQVLFYKLTPFLLVFHAVDKCCWASPGKEKKTTCKMKWQDGMSLAQLLESFLLAEARRHSLTHLSSMCVSSSSAWSVCKSLLDAPTSPSCIFLKCYNKENKEMQDIVW